MRDGLADSPGLFAGGVGRFSLTSSSRQQATTPDKRFHCSVCKKAFRLEMAAKLHLQQVHGGNGAVEAGAGPGLPEEQATPTPVGVFRNAPPQAPTVVTPVQVDPYERPGRREKPAPKPLHQADREVPSLVMDKMLSVWDDIGLKRSGGQFVHSSMVMRVFAARPSDSAELLYGVVNREGENPFEGGAASQDSAGRPFGADECNIYSLNMSEAFAMASREALGPCRPAKCPNPFLMKVAREVNKVTPQAEAAELQTAPVTPFGQLAMFGQHQAPPPSPPAPQEAVDSDKVGTESNTLVSSPFGSGFDSSPFAGTATPLLADVAYSPFANAAEEEEPAPTPAPPNATAESPLPAAPSPFLPAATAASSPFTAAASPFLASPFVAANDAEPQAGSSARTEAPFSSADAFAAAVPPAAAEVPPAHVCSVCEKSFSTHEGLRMHSKAKHAIELPKEKAPSKLRTVPDLPAYIPSPVDLAMTSPFGSAKQVTPWAEVELIPYAQSMSNITIAGKIVDVEANKDGSVMLVVFVRGTSTSSDEAISVRCSSEAMRAISSPFVRGDAVFACGSLRLLPVVDERSKKMFASPVVYVTSPTGVVARLNPCD